MVAWHMFKEPIPKGLFVCHSCDQPGCVNPDHLFLGTQADNMHDAIAKGRWKPAQEVVARGEAHVLSKLTEADVRCIRASDETQVALGERYGVSHTVISNIRRYKTWRHI